MKTQINFLLILLMLTTQSAVAQFYISPTHLVFEGAGLRGIAYAGALLELEERQQLCEVQEVAGTSAGATTACLLSVGFSPVELVDQIGQTDFARFNDSRGGMIGAAIRMNREFGWFEGKAFTQWIEERIWEKTGSRDLTFAELRFLAAGNQDFYELRIVATSINNQRVISFSADTYPDMRIADAVRASMSVPFYYKPLVIDCDGHVIDSCPDNGRCDICVDGGISANYPIHVFDENGVNPGTLGFRIDSQEQIAHDRVGSELCSFEVLNFRDFITSFYVFVLESNNRSGMTAEDWNRTVLISDCDLSPRVRKLSQAEKEALIEAGRKAAREYVETAS